MENILDNQGFLQAHEIYWMSRRPTESRNQREYDQNTASVREKIQETDGGWFKHFYFQLINLIESLY